MTLPDAIGDESPAIDILARTCHGVVAQFLGCSFIKENLL
jgi:hypothetical protein